VAAVKPKQEWETATERTDRELAMRGTVRCALCGWSATGSMKDVIKDQIEHRESHGVEHHPDVAKRSRNAKRSKGAQQRVKDRARAKRVAKLVEFVEAQGGMLDRDALLKEHPEFAPLLPDALASGDLVKRMKGVGTRTDTGVQTFIALPDATIDGREPAVAPASPALAEALA
jgi:hypothetical protein